MNPRYPVVAARAGHRCEYCQAPEAVFNFPFEVEHIVPPNRHGPDDESNWALACRACNLPKSDHVEAVDPVSGARVRLFHPRRDNWQEHFRLDGATGEIVGLTAIGRATVALLKMNSPAQLTARRLWSRLRLLPA
ncbi:MAG: HNH endonuclease [Verrucomicrobia bacterium]|nr:HNH endonuclease [Verrucomicrobiota bacterium]